jgi:hypothetical protein
VLVCTRYLGQLYQYRCPLLAVDYDRYKTSCVTYSHLFTFLCNYCLQAGEAGVPDPADSY